MKAFFATFLVTLVLASIVLEPVNALSGSNALSGYCEGRCKDRCAAAGMKDRCLKYCNICCLKCKCVPKGTFGNKHLCPCYRDVKNSKGKPKCP